MQIVLDVLLVHAGENRVAVMAELRRLFSCSPAEAKAALGLPHEKWSRSYGRFGLCVRSNSAGETYPSEECRRTRL